MNFSLLSEHKGKANLIKFVILTSILYSFIAECLVNADVEAQCFLKF